MGYHDMGPSGWRADHHIAYGVWNGQVERTDDKLAFRHGLRILCPFRAGYSLSTNLNPKADVWVSTRIDTEHLLDHLGIDRLPYAPQGADLLFASNFTKQFLEKISAVIGICASP